MFLIQEKRKKGTYLCIVRAYRDPITKATKKKRIQNIGYLEELQKQYPDPIEYFKNVAKQMTDDYNTETTPIQIDLDPKQHFETGIDLTKNFGYAALSALYHELKLDVFFRGRQRYLDVDYNINSIMKLLVYGGILYPGSINHIYKNKNQFFDKMDFSLEDIYHSFQFFYPHKASLQSWIFDQIKENYGHNTKQLYCYLIKQYFEPDEYESPNKAKNLKKEHKAPVVRMELLTDSNGFPISYDLTYQDIKDMLLVSTKTKNRVQAFGAEKVILVGDNGINNSNSLYSMVSKGDGYIVSQSIRSAGQDIKNYVLNQEGYIAFDECTKIKSRICIRTLRIKEANGNIKNLNLKEKQIVYYNEKYSKCIMSERENMLLKAKDLIASPSKYNKETAYSAAKYVQNIKFDKATGEILQNKQPLYLDKATLTEEEKYDGYYLILTSEFEETEENLVNAYINLWTIEDTFKYVNNDYHTKPNFVSRKEHMQTHYLACFISHTLTRILEEKTGNKFPLETILKSLRKCNCVNVEGNNYLQCYYDSVLDLIGNKLGINFSTRFRTLRNIKEDLVPTRREIPR